MELYNNKGWLPAIALAVMVIEPVEVQAVPAAPAKPAAIVAIAVVKKQQAVKLIADILNPEKPANKHFSHALQEVIDILQSIVNPDKEVLALIKTLIPLKNAKSASEIKNALDPHEPFLKTEALKLLKALKGIEKDFLKRILKIKDAWFPTRWSFAMEVSGKIDKMMALKK